MNKALRLSYFDGPTIENPVSGSEPLASQNVEADMLDCNDHIPVSQVRVCVSV